MPKIQILALCILFYMLSSLLTVFVTENISDREVQKQTLYDVIHNLVPTFPKPYVPTYALYFFLIYTLLRWSMTDISKISLYFLSLAVLLLMRLFTFTLTQTPPPRNKDSKWRIDHCKRNVLSNFGISFAKMSGTCVDNMFSGHAAHIVVPLVIIFMYSKNNIEKIGLSLLGFVSLITVITGRLHYTSDVIVSTIISSLTVFFLSKKLNYFN